MTKFEEEVDKVAKQVGYESLSLLIGDCEEANKIYIHFKNWHSDEEFHELSEKLDDTNDALVIAQNSRDEFEREYKKLKSQLQQQALPVVPDCVAEYISELKEKGHGIQFGLMCSTYDSAGEGNEKAIHWKDDNAEDFARAWLDGYQVEKPQLFYIELPNVYGLSVSVFVSKVENGTILEFTKGKDYALAFTEQEIKSIDERYWQFAVPVEDGE